MQSKKGGAQCFYVVVLGFSVGGFESHGVFYYSNMIDVVGKSQRRKIISKLYVSRRKDFICDKIEL